YRLVLPLEAGIHGDDARSGGASPQRRSRGAAAPTDIAPLLPIVAMSAPKAANGNAGRKTPAAKRKRTAFRFLRLLGPGLVTGAADDDPSGIATYSQAGAHFGYGLLWTVFLTTPFMIAIQLVSGYIGRVTGKGIIANVKQFYPRPLVFVLIALLVTANTINIAADLAAMGAALYLVIGGLQHEHTLIFAATSVLLQVFVPYHRYAPLLKYLTLVLFLYVAVVFTIEIQWGQVLRGTFVPAITFDRDFLMM